MSCTLIAVFATLAGIIAGTVSAQMHNIIPWLAERAS